MVCDLSYDRIERGIERLDPPRLRPRALHTAQRKAARCELQHVSARDSPMSTHMILLAVWRRPFWRAA